MVDKNQSQKKRGRDDDEEETKKDLNAQPQTPLRPSRVTELRRSEGRPKPRSKNTFYSPKSIWKCVKTEPWTPDEESKKDRLVRTETQRDEREILRDPRERERERKRRNETSS